jgi:lipoprotein-anchoring transpeptidase ErfK/SrfK
MEYHQGGYFLNGSWWRADYGVGTNFPHQDSGGNEAFAGNGSLGNIELAENNAAWLYEHTAIGDSVLVY